MTKGKRGWYWLAALAALTLYGCPYHWGESYDYDGKQPFDLYALHQLLEARPEGLVMLEDSLGTLETLDSGRHVNYIFVGQYAMYDDISVTEMLNFVERGNTALIAAYELPAELSESLYGGECYNGYQNYNYSIYQRAGNSYNSDTVLLDLNAGDSIYQMVNVRYYQPASTPVYYVPDDYLCDDLLNNVALGYADTTRVNFVRLGWGEGDFYLLTTPVYLTNYYLDDSVQYAYAEEVMNTVLGPGPVYWDEFSRLPAQRATQRRRQAQQQNPGNTTSGGTGRNLLNGNETLRYIQEQPELSMAWYTLFAGVLLMVLFRGKRRQRIIPAIRRRENSSRRFIDTMARLIYQKGNHTKLARQEMGALRFHLREKHNIRWPEGEELPANLADQLGLPETTVERARIETRMVINQVYFDETALIKFYRAIHPLYQAGRAETTRTTEK